MESWEDKIIRDKMDSLQQLPIGYLPDLSSKWEIIEAGLPQQKKRIIPLLVRWSVAAAILACAIVAGVKITINKKKSDIMMASVKMPSLHISMVIQKEQTAAVTKPAVIKKNESQKTLKPVAVSKIETITKQKIKQLISDEFKIDQVISIINSATVGTDETVTTIPQPEIPKRAKRRTFQKDFNDGLLVMDTGYSKPASPQFSFKLQLHKSTGDEAQPSRRLQLKQSL